MSGRRRRGLLATVLRGGALGRRIRVKSILLSSSRSDLDRLGDWVRFEAAKGILPLLPVLIAGLAGRPLPNLVSGALAAAGFGWMIFVSIHAYAMAFRLNRRHDAYMKAVGVDTNLLSVLRDKALWRKAADGMTMRDFIAARRTIPARC